jgi:hypothetical protein
MKDDKSSAPWWIALGVGTGLILFPEPATTGAGILIVLAAVGVKASEIAEGVISG